MKTLHYALIFLLVPTFAKAQDTHYWTNQYGNRTALLGGAVVGGIDDNAMVFYNPGALAFIPDNSISVNANVYQIENIKITDVLGGQAGFKSSSFAAVPVLLGGMVNLKNKNWKLGYGLMSPVQFNFRATARLDGMFDVVDNAESPGKETVIGETEKNSALSELAATVGVARKTSDKFSFGMSLLFTLRNQNYSSHLLTHTLLNDTQQTPVSTTLLTETKYFHVRSQAKFGINYRSDPWKLGLTVTTPSMRLMGNGLVAADLTTTNLKINDERKDIFASDRQEKLKSIFKVPLSVSGGAIYAFQKSSLMFTAEYFSAVGRYAVLQPDPSEFFRSENVAIALGSDQLLKVPGGAKSVLNVAVAYEQVLNASTTLHFSLRNNQSYRLNSNEYQGIDPEITNWDIYHFTAGTTLNKNKNSLSLGLLVSYGNSDHHVEQYSVDDPAESGGVLGNPVITRAQYFSVGLLLGYKFNFKD